ncbi:MAG: hypothetical protein P8Y58_06990 [Novosphingobium sp.]
MQRLPPHSALAIRSGPDSTPGKIERVIEGSSAPGWSEHEAALLRAVEDMIADQCIADAARDILAKTYDEKQMLELPMRAGSCLMTAIQQNSRKIQPKGNGFDYC